MGNASLFILFLVWTPDLWAAVWNQLLGDSPEAVHHQVRASHLSPFHAGSVACFGEHALFFGDDQGLRALYALLTLRPILSPHHRWERQQELLPPSQRKPLPQPPKDSPVASPGGKIDFVAQNEAAFEAYQGWVVIL